MERQANKQTDKLTHKQTAKRGCAKRAQFCLTRSWMVHILPASHVCCPTASTRKRDRNMILHGTDAVYASPPPRPACLAYWPPTREGWITCIVFLSFSPARGTLGEPWRHPAHTLCEQIGRAPVAPHRGELSPAVLHHACMHCDMLALSARRRRTTRHSTLQSASGQCPAAQPVPHTSKCPGNRSRATRKNDRQTETQAKRTAPILRTRATFSGRGPRAVTRERPRQIDET